MPGIQDRFAAFAVLKGPDVVPQTNPSSLSRDFRSATSTAIAEGTYAEKLNGEVEIVRSEASSSGRKFSAVA
jgi:hypothetical protein